MIELEWVENDSLQNGFGYIGSATNDCTCSDGIINWD